MFTGREPTCDETQTVRRCLSASSRGMPTVSTTCLSASCSRNFVVPSFAFTCRDVAMHLSSAVPHCSSTQYSPQIFRRLSGEQLCILGSAPFVALLRVTCKWCWVGELQNIGRKMGHIGPVSTIHVLIVRTHLLIY